MLMKNLVVCGVVLLLGILGPQQDHRSPFDALWSLGALALVPYILQQFARRLKLPALVGWMTAGLLTGASGLQLVQPAALETLSLVRTLAAVWVGFQVGIHFSWPRALNWRGPLLIGLVTLATLILVTIGIALVAEPPWWIALLLGAVASLWGPFAVLPTPARRGALLLGVLGTGFSLLFLSTILGLLQVRGLLPDTALLLVGRLWLSLLAGAIGAELLQRFGLFSARASTLAAGLFAAFFFTAIFLQQLQLYALPCGFGAGLVLIQQRVPAKRMRLLLRSLSPVAFMLFFALAGATIDLKTLWPPVPGLLAILLTQLLVLVIVRGVGPAIYYPLPAPDPQARGRLGWLLLPRGALLFELIYHRQGGLLSLLGDHPTRLLHQVALADILIHLLIFSTLAGIIQHLFPPAAPTVPAADSEAPSAP